MPMGVNFRSAFTPFVSADDGFAPGEAVECLNPTAAIMKGEALACKPGFVGAIAFSLSADLATGDWGGEPAEVPRIAFCHLTEKICGCAE